MASYGNGTSQGDFDPNANHNAELISVCVVFATLSTAAVATRYYSMRTAGITASWEFYLLLGAWAIAVGESITFCTAIPYGKAGYHTAVLSSENIVYNQKIFYVAPLLQPTGLAFAKLSILVLFHRIFVLHKFRVAVWVMGAIVIAWWVASFFGAAFICYPISHIWTPNEDGTCDDIILLAIWNIIEINVTVACVAFLGSGLALTVITAWVRLLYRSARSSIV